MGKQVERNGFSQIVNIDDKGVSADLCIQRLITYMGWPEDRILPIYLKLIFPEDPTPREISTIRYFLRQVKTLSSKHFLRFIVPVCWAVESGNVECFYTYSEKHDPYFDSAITIKVIDRSSMHLCADGPRDRKKQKQVFKLSKTLVGEILRCMDTETGIAGASKIPIDTIAKHFRSDNFKLLIISSLEGNAFYTIPVMGYRLEDMQRRIQYSDRFIRTMGKIYQKYTSPVMNPGGAIQMLLDLIREEEEDGDRYRTARATHELCELLYGYYVMAASGDVNKYNLHTHVVIFDTEVHQTASDIIVE